MTFIKELWNRRKEYPCLTIMIVAINVILYLLNSMGVDFFYKEGLLNVQGVVADGEYGRLLWSIFLHADLNHLFSNMIILMFLGALLERTMGTFIFGTVFFLSGLGGNLFSLFSKILSHSNISSLGASGAVFGMDGMLLAMVLLSKRRQENITPQRVLFMIILSLYSGFSSSNVDNSAHIGGLVVGFLVASVFCIIDNRKLEKGIARRGG